MVFWSRSRSYGPSRAAHQLWVLLRRAGEGHHDLYRGAVMSEVLGVGSRPSAIRTVAAPAYLLGRSGARRELQLVLGVIWLLDGVLQLQGFFFTQAFGSEMISMSAPGNPWFIARAITWSGAVIAHHAVPADSAFALVQVAIGLGIAWGPTLKLALAGSVVWSLGVWWIGEGFGGIFSGTANPVNGAPGAVIIYGLLAVLLWPRERDDVAPPAFPAAGAVGARGARMVWLVLWGSLSYFAVAGANSSAQGLHDLVSSMAPGEPGWLAWLDRSAASLLAHQGLAASVLLAVLLAIVATGVYLPQRLGNATVALAVVLGLALWVVGENFGALFTNSATDVNSGPLLILLGAAFWRRRPAHPRTHRCRRTNAQRRRP